MSPLDRLDSRLEDLLDSVERGEPIDYEKQAKLAALDIAIAGVHYTREAIDESNRRDTEMIELVRQEDGSIT